jgi:hypothetical protein
VEREIPTPYEGVQLQGEGGIRHVTIYDLRFRPFEEYQEPVGSGGPALRVPEVNVEVPSKERWHRYDRDTSGMMKEQRVIDKMGLRM